jgi:hypothetical protein
MRENIVSFDGTPTHLATQTLADSEVAYRTPPLLQHENHEPMRYTIISFGETLLPLRRQTLTRSLTGFLQFSITTASTPFKFYAEATTAARPEDSVFHSKR